MTLAVSGTRSNSTTSTSASTSASQPSSAGLSEETDSGVTPRSPASCSAALRTAWPAQGLFGSAGSAAIAVAVAGYGVLRRRLEAARAALGVGRGRSVPEPPDLSA